ncbi:DUF1207 domain-containing protein [Methylomonas koyamae]|uniref:DUF1207 domain-containing protein n=1 Tax=Methylomonas koyamae TaxID=702114 RepID=UPI0021B1CD3A|nr:DUF1207 domain-containing protein [Methylomonas koyamae]
MEFKRAWRLDFPPMRPVIAADIKHYDENSRSRDISVCAGVDFDKSKLRGRKLQILVEYVTVTPRLVGSIMTRWNMSVRECNIIF